MSPRAQRILGPCLAALLGAAGYFLLIHWAECTAQFC
jgi:hypothetical protein